VQKNLLSFLLLALFLSCKPAKETTEASTQTTVVAEKKTEVAATAQSGDSLLASIERTACYGTCPIYKFSIYNSGYAVYEGKRFVEKIGRFETHINPPVLDEIRTKAIAVKYFDFRDEYPKTASDFPATKTAVVLDGKRKDVNNGSGGPTALKEFQDYLDNIKDSAEWKEVH